MAESIRQAVVKENSRASNRTADRIEPNRCAQSAVDALRIAYGSGSLKRGPQVLTLSRAASQNSSWSQRTLLLLQRTRGNQYVQRMMLQTGQSGESTADSYIKSAGQQNRDGRNLGNSGLSLVVQQTNGMVQRKVGNGQPEDHYEQEADRVAARVVRMSIPAIGTENTISERRQIFHIQRICAECEEDLHRQAKDGEEEEELKRQSRLEKRWLEQGGIGTKIDRLIQRQGNEPTEGNALSEERHREEQLTEPGLFSSRGGANSLPGDVRSFMEPRFGYEFGDVRIHNDSDAANSAKRIGAAAYTSGNDIYFGAGKYQPSTANGRELIAHELVHVIQQAQRSTNSGPNRGGWNPRDEGQADRDSHVVKRKPDHTGTQTVASSISPYNQSEVQLTGTITALAAPAELAAGRGRTARARATAAAGVTVDWSIQGAANGATITPAGRSATITAPAGSTGGNITIRAADAANPGVDFEDAVVALVEVQQPTFAFAPAMPAFAPANTMDASVCDNTATANAVVLPGGRPAPVWSIRGNRRGAAIDPATGVITPSATQTGNITVRATDGNLADAFAEQVLTIQAHPTGIRNTIISAFPLGYGATYTHTFGSSGGSLANIFVTERIFCGNDPVGFCPRAAVPILPGTINARINAANQMDDHIRTNSANPGIDVNRFLPSPPNPGLPQTLTTPQILYWRSDQCSPAPTAAAAAAGDFWIPFQNVAMQGILFRGTGANPFFFRTIVNGVATRPEPYTGPALAVGAAPVASVCGAGEGISNVSFNPSTIAADASALTTTAATAQVRPGGNLVTWSFPGPNFGANIVAQGNPALFSAGNIAGQVRVRAAMTANPGCFTEGWLRMQEVVIGPAIKFSPGTIRTGGTARATVSTKPGNRIVTWSIEGPALGAVIAGNPDNSATITAGAQVGRITVRATDQRDATRFAEASLIIN
ncbi:MAG: DUF4157 domain-containing protein [Pyrinomonadaceae bacterium]|nr:DUF4157 domain-containing protein [Pyrinomonadaceae bacterium]